MSVPRLKERYEAEVKAQLQEQLGLANVMEVPVFDKIVLNMGIGEAVQDKKAVEQALDEFESDLWPEAQGEPGAQVDRQLQGP